MLQGRKKAHIVNHKQTVIRNFKFIFSGSAENAKKKILKVSMAKLFCNFISFSPSDINKVTFHVKKD